MFVTTVTQTDTFAETHHILYLKLIDFNVSQLHHNKIIKQWNSILVKKGKRQTKPNVWEEIHGYWGDDWNNIRSLPVTTILLYSLGLVSWIQLLKFVALLNL